MHPISTLIIEFHLQKIRPFSSLNGAKIAKIILTIIFGINF